MLNVALAILKQTMSKHPVDVDRISVSGVSSGGSACWAFALRHPDLFSAVAPLASGGIPVSEVDKLIGLPVWAFHSTRDAGTTVDGVRATVSALQHGGGTAHLTEIDTHRHDCWHAAFEAYDLLDWLLVQKRGEASQHPPGARVTRGRIIMAWRSLTTGWTPLLLLGQFGIPLLLILALWSARRKRRRSSSVARRSAA